MAERGFRRSSPPQPHKSPQGVRQRDRPCFSLDECCEVALTAQRLGMAQWGSDLRVLVGQRQGSEDSCAAHPTPTPKQLALGHVPGSAFSTLRPPSRHPRVHARLLPEEAYCAGAPTTGAVLAIAALGGRSRQPRPRTRGVQQSSRRVDRGHVGRDQANGSGPKGRDRD